MASWSLITYCCAFAMLLLAYLLGSIPSAVWIGKKYYGIDIREHGSKNAGTTNMLRVLGKRAAIPVFILDFFKGFAAVSLCSILRYDDGINDAWMINLKILAVFAAVLGHIFPIFAGGIENFGHEFLSSRTYVETECASNFPQLGETLASQCFHILHNQMND